MSPGQDASRRDRCCVQDIAVVGGIADGVRNEISRGRAVDIDCQIDLPTSGTVTGLRPRTGRCLIPYFHEIGACPRIGKERASVGTLVLCHEAQHQCIIGGEKGGEVEIGVNAATTTEGSSTVRFVRHRAFFASRRWASASTDFWTRYVQRIATCGEITSRSARLDSRYGMLIRQPCSTGFLIKPTQESLAPISDRRVSPLCNCKSCKTTVNEKQPAIFAFFTSFEPLLPRFLAPR